MKNKGLIVALVVVLAVVFIAAIWFVGTRNSLLVMLEDVQAQQSNVETYLQRRNDLIPNLVSTVKGYAKHEEDVYTAIADARAKLAGTIKNSGDPDEISAANAELESAISRLLVIVEQYPELKASEQFIALQDELAGTENRITYARQEYNDVVKTYNKKIKMFPTSIVANMLGLTQEKYFKADEKAQEVPVVNFD